LDDGRVGITPSLQRLIRVADRTMYSAKGNGGNGAEIDYLR